jgi:tRNA(fMet)-specific endonuclease VapC
VNNSLLDTDILSEIIEGIDQTVAANNSAYRNARGRYTLSAISLMEVVRGFQKNQSFRRMQAFVASLAGEGVLAFEQATGELAGRIAGELRYGA